jgi:hypothetical protein
VKSFVVFKKTTKITTDNPAAVISVVEQTITKGTPLVFLAYIINAVKIVFE